MNQLRPPYGLILEQLREGRVIPFLGSGASLGGRKAEEKWDKNSSSFLPTASELAFYLAEKTEFPQDELLDLAPEVAKAVKDYLAPDLAKVAQYYDVIGGRNPLQQELHYIFARNYPPTSLHNFLAGLGLLFCGVDLKDPAGLASKLRNIGDPLSSYLKEQLPTAAQQLLDQYDGTRLLPEELKRAVVCELNRLLKGNSLYDEQRFKQARLTEETQSLATQNPQGEDLMHLNRRLLAEAYPQEILNRSSLPKPLLIVTTNYDDLIERAFSDMGHAYDLVVHTTDPALGDRLLWWPHGEHEPSKVSPNQLDIDLQKVTVIYKMHGAVNRLEPTRDQYVITEEDYIDFLARMTKNKAIPAIFAEPFQTRHFLFLGYGLRDWNLRVVLNRIEKDLRRRKDIKSWAIQYKPSALERRFWQERGVEVYDKTIEAFVKELDWGK